MANGCCLLGFNSMHVGYHSIQTARRSSGFLPGSDISR